MNGLPVKNSGIGGLGRNSRKGVYQEFRL